MLTNLPLIPRQVVAMPAGNWDEGWALPGPDWVYTAAGCLLFVLAAWWIVRRARSARRAYDAGLCRGCGYDVRSVMASGGDGVRCPECGRARAVAPPRGLGVGSRRVWLGVSALLLLAVAVQFLPTLRRYHWSRFMPDWYVARVGPDGGSGDPLRNELRRRMLSGQIKGERLAGALVRMGWIVPPAKWPRGVPIHVREPSNETWREMSSGLWSVPIVVERETGVSSEFRYEMWVDPWVNESHWDYSYVTFARRTPPIRWKGDGFEAMLYTEKVHLPVTPVASIDEVLTPVTDEVLKEHGLSSMLRPRLLFSEHVKVWGLSVPIVMAYTKEGPRIAFGIRATILRGGEVIECFRWHTSSVDHQARWELVRPESSWSNPEVAFAPPVGGEVNDCVVRIETDEEMALCEFDATHYWRGSFEVPLSALLGK